MEKPQNLRRKRFLGTDDIELLVPLWTNMIWNNPHIYELPVLLRRSCKKSHENPRGFLPSSSSIWAAFDPQKESPSSTSSGASPSAPRLSAERERSTIPSSDGSNFLHLGSWWLRNGRMAIKMLGILMRLMYCILFVLLISQMLTVHCWPPNPHMPLENFPPGRTEPRYPSEKQFYSSATAKGHQLDPKDMSILGDRWDAWSLVITLSTYLVVFWELKKGGFLVSIIFLITELEWIPGSSRIHWA